MATTVVRPSPLEPNARDWYPPRVFLAQLVGPGVDAVFGDQHAFFGTSSARLWCPAAVNASQPSSLLNSTSALHQPAMLAMRSALALAAGQSVKLRFLFGYLPLSVAEGGSSKQNYSLAELVAKYSSPATDLLKESSEIWRSQLAHISLPESSVEPNSQTADNCSDNEHDGEIAGQSSGNKQSKIATEAVESLIARETQWRSHHFLSAAIQSDYFETNVITQGSAYLYLHGQYSLLPLCGSHYALGNCFRRC